MSEYRVEATPGAAKQLRQKAGSAQMTFRVAREHAAVFASALLPADRPCEHAALVVEGVSGALHHVGPLIAHPPLAALPRDTTIGATGPAAATALLAAALSDHMDFWFVPKPVSVFVFADNDEYATVFAQRQGAVSKAGQQLLTAGIPEIRGYER